MFDQIRAQSRRDQLLILVFGILILYVISTWIIVISGIPEYYRRVTTQTIPTVQMASEEQVSNALIGRNASNHGLTLEQYAIYTVVSSLFYLVIFGGAAGLILWKAGANWFAWYTVFILLFFPTGGSLNEINQVSQVTGEFYGVGAILWPLYLLYLYLFPNGRALPKWTRGPMAAILTLHLALMVVGFLINFGIGVELLSIWERLGLVVILAGFPLILISQVLRYRANSTPIERLQTKWFVVGMAFTVFITTIVTVITGSLELNEVGWWGDLAEMLYFLIPISLVISILRYRLWDIDVVIRRTLVYTLLTATLALVYFGLVISLEGALRIVVRSSGQVATVISTLAVAALFAPLRRRVQAVIDRRFFRQRYNAEQVLARFSLTARDEVELDALIAEIVETVEQSMRPERVSLWLKREQRPEQSPIFSASIEPGQPSATLS